MFDTDSFASDLERLLVIARESVDPEIYQPEFYSAILRASILRLPIEWSCSARRLVLERADSPVEEIVKSLAHDLEQSMQEPAQRRCYELLMRYALILIANEQTLRSTGPGQAPSLM
jgi:hypothetical protein